MCFLAKTNLFFIEKAYCFIAKKKEIVFYREKNNFVFITSTQIKKYGYNISVCEETTTTNARPQKVRTCYGDKYLFFPKKCQL